MRRCVVLAFGVLALGQTPNVVMDHPLHFDVNLVQVDVVVEDRSGQRPDDLNANDFEVRQDGKPQQITHFLFVPRAQSASPMPASRQLERTEVRRTFLLFVDDAHISFLDFSQTREALRHFVDQELQPGDLCALYRTSGGPGATRVFSSDLREIRDNVERMHWLHTPLFEQNAFETDFHDAIRALQALPGRKTIVLVNSGFEFYGPFNYRASLYASTMIPAMTRRFSDEANRASVVVYAIDSRGLPVETDPAQRWMDASQSGNVHPAIGTFPALHASNVYTKSQDLPSDLAHATGGLFLHDSNDLSGELDRIAADNSGYYLVGWNPGAAAFEWKGQPDYHKIQVKVRRTGLTVRTRAGFFGKPDTGRPSPSARTQMDEALFSPFRSGDLDVDLAATFQHDDAAGSYVESLIHVRPRGIVFSDGQAGCRTAKLEVLTTAEPLEPVSGEKGHANSQIEACGDSAEQVLRDGIVYSIPAPVSHPGPYDMRVAVRNVPASEDAPSIGPAGLVNRPQPDVKPTMAIGSASEYVSVPDLRKTELALGGVFVRAEGIPAQPGPGAGQSWWPALDGDAAVREFHPGDTIHYETHVFEGGSGPGDVRDIQSELLVMREGVEVSHRPVSVERGEIEGNYNLDSDALPGQYLLRVTVAEGSGKKQREAAEWTTFSVVRQAR
jgi:VWFA-related protein